jgi:hypothetical protein
MKRYGDNLPIGILEELENSNKKTDLYLAGNCAVRQDMVSFLVPTDAISKSKKSRDWNIFSLFRFRQKKIKERGG